MELRYNKGRMAGLLVVATLLCGLCSWLAITHPAPSGHGRYQALYDLVGPVGITILIGAGALLFAVGAVVAAVNLASDGVAARITAAGLEFNDIWGRRTVAWTALRGFDTKTVRVRGRDMHHLIVLHDACRMGPFTREKTGFAHADLHGRTDAVIAWTHAAAHAAARACLPSEAPAASTPARAFGRRTRSVGG